MSKKARRRPTWRKKPHFYLNLICKETGKLLETIRFTKGSERMIRMLHKLGPEEMERELVHALETIAKRTIKEHETRSLEKE